MLLSPLAIPVWPAGIGRGDECDDGSNSRCESEPRNLASAGLVAGGLGNDATKCSIFCHFFAIFFSI